jgi:competence protein ComEA
MSMDPAMPDWRAFGQPVTATTAEPARPDGRASFMEALARVPRGTRIAVIVAAAMAIAGLALAVVTPTGGDVALVAPDGSSGAPLAAEVPQDVAARSTGSRPASGPELVVDVAGAVARPGLVRLPAGSRIGDAIAAAGGYSSTTDLEASAATLNLAAPIVDGAKVLVPVLGTVASVSTGPTAPTGGGLTDLNGATEAALEDLPGIGPVTAGRIIEARGQAPFASVDELRSRGLVGGSTFEKLRDLVTVGP